MCGAFDCTCKVKKASPLLYNYQKAGSGDILTYMCVMKRLWAKFGQEHMWKLVERIDANVHYASFTL